MFFRLKFSRLIFAVLFLFLLVDPENHLPILSHRIPAGAVASIPFDFFAPARACSMLFQYYWQYHLHLSGLPVKLHLIHWRHPLIRLKLIHLCEKPNWRQILLLRGSFHRARVVSMPHRPNDKERITPGNEDADTGK